MSLGYIGSDDSALIRRSPESSIYSTKPLAAFALRHRLRGSIGIGVGIALGNDGYILLAMMGGAAIQQMPPLFILLQLAGALYSQPT
ncbi:hypothetical protein [Symbiopectobacterium purcellii]|uniref:hypothetical protein n=1 Tax=Symbiopectobacterium purcellii TaxID=2871826 RepID=UPI003F86A51D